MLGSIERMSAARRKGVGLQLGVEDLGNQSGKAEREFGYLNQRSARRGSGFFEGDIPDLNELSSIKGNRIPIISSPLGKAQERIFLAQ